MLNVHELSPQDFVGLSPAAAAELATRVLAHVGAQSRQIESQAQALQFKEAKIQSIMFELRRLKAWRFAAKTERMNAEQRQLFEETLAADQADLEAQLAALNAASKESGDTSDSGPDNRRQPKRQALPEHLKRVLHHHEPENTICGCGQAMVLGVVQEDRRRRRDRADHRHGHRGRCRRGQGVQERPAPGGLDRFGAAPVFLRRQVSAERHQQAGRHVPEQPADPRRTSGAALRTEQDRCAQPLAAGADRAAWLQPCRGGAGQQERARHPGAAQQRRELPSRWCRSLSRGQPQIALQRICFEGGDTPSVGLRSFSKVMTKLVGPAI